MAKDQKVDRTMTPADVAAWGAAMARKHLAPNWEQCAFLLGVNPKAMSEIKERGANRRTALACAALLAGLKPYRAPRKRKAKTDG